MTKRIFLVILCLLMVAAPLSVAAADADATTETRGPEQATAGTYEFILEDMWIFDDRDHMNGKNPTKTSVSIALAEYYEKNEVNWKYATDNLKFMKTETNYVNNTYCFGSTSTYKWRGLRLGATVQEEGSSKQYVDGYWTAFTFRAPTAGYYTVDLDYMTRNDGCPQGEVYFFDGKYTEAIELETMVGETDPIGVVDFSSKVSAYEPASARVGQIHVTSEEFTLVFRAAAKVSPTTCCYMVLNNIFLKATDAPDNSAEKVEQMIEALGQEPTREALEAAKQAYNALPDAEKKLVKNAARLSALENKLNQLDEMNKANQNKQNTGNSKLLLIVVIAAAAVVGTCVVVVVVVMVSSKKGRKKKSQ